MSASAHAGGCLCGAVRYRATGTPVRVTNCHCEMCRRAAGAPFVTWAEFPAEAVTFTAGAPARHGSSEAAERGFCAACGAALTFAYLDGETIDLTVATLDDPGDFPPEDNIWTESKLPWVALDAAIPAWPRRRGDGEADA